MQQPQESWKNHQERAGKRVEKLKRGAKIRGVENFPEKGYAVWQASKVAGSGEPKRTKRLLWG